MNKIKEIINNQFEAVFLDEIESANLMNRRDSKYVLNTSQLNTFLVQMSEYYNVLEIENKRIFRYESHYFDTADLTLFKMHLNGKLNRYKIRQRNYIDTQTGFFEVKFKNNHGSTIKKRYLNDSVFKQKLEKTDEIFLEKNSNLQPNNNNFQYSLTTDYQRITLINKNKTERITIDLNLIFRNNNTAKYFSDMAIIEIKQQKNSQSIAKTILKNLKIRKGGISKYCIGVILLNKNIKYNRLKPKFDKIYKPFQLVS